MSGPLAIPDVILPLPDDILPPKAQIFRAFELCPVDQARVVILGQDPYPTPGNANGLAFSVYRGQKLPASLKHIFQELVEDIGCPMPTHGDLTAWAEQGVLLANASLTVLPGQANVHKAHWVAFTRDWIRRAGAADATPKVWLLWGGPAQKNLQYIDATRHKVITSVHPSPLSAYRGFFGSRPFSKVNAALVELGLEPVDWTLPAYQ